MRIIRKSLLAATVLGALPLVATPAEARRIVIDEVNFIESDGCIFSDNSCAYQLPFLINFGSGLTNQVYLYESFGSAALTLGAPLSGPGDEVFDGIFFSGDFQEGIFTASGNEFALDEYAFGPGVGPVASLTFTDLSGSGTAGDFSITIRPTPDSFAFGDQFGYRLTIGPQTFSCEDGSTAGTACDLTEDFEPLEFRTFTFRNTAAIPEPGTWAMMLFGFGAVGFAMRRRRKDDARVRFAF